MIILIRLYYYHTSQRVIATFRTSDTPTAPKPFGPKHSRRSLPLSGPDT